MPGENIASPIIIRKKSINLETYSPEVKQIKVRYNSATNIFKRNIKSASLKKPDYKYLKTYTTVNLPTSPTGMFTYETNFTNPGFMSQHSGQLRVENTNTNIKPHKTRLHSACTILRSKNMSMGECDKKSIIHEDVKTNFNRCIEVNKKFLLKNNPNMCLFEVAEIFGSSKLIHYKNITL
jgi:hypothetical protein